MSSYIFDGEINIDSARELLEAIKEGSTTIYMRTPGGSITFVDVICRELLENKCKLVGFDHLSSSGTEVFFRYTGEKELLDGTQMAFHLPTVQVDYRETIRDKSDNYHRNCDTMCVEDMDDMWKDYIASFKTYGLSDEMIAELVKGETVFLKWGEVKKLNFGPSYKQSTSKESSDVVVNNDLTDDLEIVDTRQYSLSQSIETLEDVIEYLKRSTEWDK